MDDLRKDEGKAELPGGGPRKPTKTPTMGHFYVLLGLLVLIAAASGTGLFQLKSTAGDLETDLTNTGKAFREAQETQGKTLSDRMAELEGALADTSRKLNSVAKELEDTRTELAAFRTQTQVKLSDAAKAQEEFSKSLDSSKLELNGRIDATRTEFGTTQEEMKTTVTQLKADADFIVAELGKKAEKAYMLFMERKLKKDIAGVSDKVDGVKTDLEQQIVSARDRIEEVAGGLGETIKKKVEEHVKIEFVPSAQDEEE